MVSIKAGELAGMITDLIRTAAKEVHLGVLHGVHLYTVQPADPNEGLMLIGESSNRFVAGQAREPVDGNELAPVVLGLPEAKAALTLVKGLPEIVPVSLTMSGDLLLVESTGLRAEYPTVYGQFPNLRRIQGPAAKMDQVVLREDVLAPVLAVSKRRGVHMGFVLSGQRKAVQVQVGDRYQALVMPVQNVTVGLSPMWTAQPAAEPVAA